MKHISRRVLALLLALAMILAVAGCKKKEPSSSEPSSSSKPSSSESSSSKKPGIPTGGKIEDIKLKESVEKGIQRNSDTIGWIKIPNTDIDDAVIQYIDNDYYLRLDEDKNYDIFGCYWADYNCILDLGREDLSPNTIIYGHSDYRDNPEGKRFSQLFHYTDLEFLKKNPYIYFSTGDDEMVWQIFAVFYTRINFNYIQANPSKEVMEEIIKEAKERSEYIIDLDVTGDDKVLTLSTCTGKLEGHLYPNGDYDNYRYVIMAKLLPAGETGECTTDMKVNPDPERS